MADALVTFLEISIIAALMICLIGVFRAVFSKRINPVIITILWIAVLLRLCIPFTIESPVHVDDLIGSVSVNSPQETAPMPAIDPEPAMTSGEALSVYGGSHHTNTAMAEPIAEPVNAPEPTMIDRIGEWLRKDTFWSTLAWVWIIGAIGVILYTIYQAFKIKRKIGEGYEVTDSAVLEAIAVYKEKLGIKRSVRIWRCDCVDTPAIFGYLRPYLLLPIRMEVRDERLGHVLLHELCHIRRQDILLGYLWLIAKALHWFNPLVWLVYGLYRDDAELCCDRMVIGHLKDGEEYAYSQTLIDVVRSSKRKAVTAAMSLCENRVRLKERVVRMLNPGKQSRLSVIVSLMLGIVMLIGGFTTACKPKTGDILSIDPSDEIVYSDEYVAGQDSEYWYTGELYNYTPMADTKDGYYFMGGPLNAFLFFMDKSTGESAPVCDKLGCEHRYDPYLAIRKNEKCNAYVGNHRIRALMMYGDTLYGLEYVGYDGSYNDTLYEFSVEGDAPKKLQQLTTGGNVESIAIHRGSVYFMTASYGDPLSEDSTYQYQLYRLHMEDLNADPELIYSLTEKRARCGRLLCYGNYVYFYASKSDKDAHEYFNQINRFNIRTGEIETILDGNVGWRYTIFNEYLAYSITGDGTYLSDLDGKNEKRISDQYGALSSGGGYLLIDTIDELSEDMQRWVYAYDGEGDLAGSIHLADWPLFPDPFGVVDGMYMIPTMDYESDRQTIYSMPVQKIADGSATPKVFYEPKQYGWDKGALR